MAYEDRVELVNKNGKLYIAFNGLKAVNHDDTWSTSYHSETVYIPLAEFVGVLELLGVKFDLESLRDRQRTVTKNNCVHLILNML